MDAINGWQDVVGSIAAPSSYDREQQARHFCSGVNAPGEVEGLAGHSWVGIAASEIRPGLLEALEANRRSVRALFVDSGAFSEVEFGANGPQVVEEIDHADWLIRFGVYDRMARAFGPRAYVVAPDRVGDQAVTLERLERYAGRCRRLVSYRAKLIVPVQKGALSMAAFWRAAVDVLDLPLHDRAGDFVLPIAGVPMKKDATSIAELRELAAALPQGWPIHLLGIGPESKRYAAALEAIRSVNPTATVTTDSNSIRRLVGRTNGRGGGARALTAAQDRARAAGAAGQELKRVALSAVYFAELRADNARRAAAGWLDDEGC